jgi:hypothetical protein
MLCISGVTILIVMVCPHQIFSYNTNRQLVLVKPDNCDYYDNPAFKVVPNFVQSRMNVVPQARQVVLIDNRLRKEPPYYNTYHTTSPSVKLPASYFPNMTPANIMEFHSSDLESHSHEEEEEIKIDYDKLWKVGESPASKSVKALPDVYVKHEDAPPIVDMLSMERSELTEETHDMENVELQEKFLNEPLSQTKEIIIERITTRPEPPSTVNPALAMFKQIDIKQVKKETARVDQEKRQASEDQKKEVGQLDLSTLGTVDGAAKSQPEKDSAVESVVRQATNVALV